MNVGVLGAGQFPPRAKRVIMLHMLGAISHVDTFDYKPMLEKMHGPGAAAVGARDAAAVDDVGRPVGVPDRRPARGRSSSDGESGAWVSDLLPYTGAIADELCFIEDACTPST